jgi:hypothetical protein
MTDSMTEGSMTREDTAAPAVSGERELAVRLFNDTWALLRREDRTPQEDDRLVHMAHASRFHWDNADDDQNRAIGEWQVSRVYAALGHGESALFHGRRCVEYASRPGTGDWLLASAHEGIARAHAAAGDIDSARESRDTALALLAAIADPEDREVVAGDIATLPIP